MNIKHRHRGKSYGKPRCFRIMVSDHGFRIMVCRRRFADETWQAVVRCRQNLCPQAVSETRAKTII